MENRPNIREELRHAVLYFLAERPRLAFPAGAIPRFLHRLGLVEAEPAVDAVADALIVLKGLGYVEEIIDPLGATSTYRATSEGVLAHERWHKGAG